MNFSKKQKVNGFTFIEIIIAVFIFALMMMAVAGIFSSSIGGYQKARAVQKNLEDAQFIMNQMAKILRTSSVVDNPANGKSIVVFDYSQGKCFKYMFDSSTKKIKFGKKDAPAPSPPSTERESFEKEPIIWCRGKKDSITLTPMAALDVTGKFDAYPSSPGSGIDGFLGRVTISMEICSNVGCTSDKAEIQTSVSLRDYYNAGI